MRPVTFMAWTAAKDSLPWSGDPFDPLLSNLTFSSKLRISMFSRRESAVFTVKNSIMICRWAGPKYAKNFDFWRSVTFQRLRVQTRLSGLCSGAQGLQDPRSSGFVGQLWRSRPGHVLLPWTGAKDPLPWSDRPFSSSVVKSDILSGLRICKFSRSESAVFTVKNGICRWAGEIGAKMSIFGGQ